MVLKAKAIPLAARELEKIVKDRWNILHIAWRGDRSCALPGLPRGNIIPFLFMPIEPKNVFNEPVPVSSRYVETCRVQISEGILNVPKLREVVAGLFTRPEGPTPAESA